MADKGLLCTEEATANSLQLAQNLEIESDIVRMLCPPSVKSPDDTTVDEKARWRQELGHHKHIPISAAFRLTTYIIPVAVETEWLLLPLH